MKKLILLLALFQNQPAPEKIQPPLPGPSLDDLYRFPCLRACEMSYAVADAHCDWLRGRVRVGDFQYLLWWKEAHRLKCLWHSLRMAQDEAYENDVRLSCLQEVWDTLTWEEWDRGQMPPPVPLDYFWEFP